MKIIDKFLKWLKTDRNTFFTYILSLATIFILVDRLVEFCFILFTGVGSTYWGPIQYALALACPVFAFLFSGSSKFTKSDKDKLKWFYTYVAVLYTFQAVFSLEVPNCEFYNGNIVTGSAKRFP